MSISRTASRIAARRRGSLEVAALLVGCGLVFASCTAGPTAAPTPGLATSAPTVGIPASTPVESPSAETTPATQPSPTAVVGILQGTYQTSFTKADLAASPMLADRDEINDANWGDFTLTFGDGRFAGSQKNALEATSSYGNFTVHADTLRLDVDHGEGAGESFAYRWSLSGDTLTFSRDDSLGLPSPTPFLIKSWTRTSAASAAPSPGPATAIPAELQSVWVGETRQVPGLTSPQVQSAVLIKPSTMQYFAAGIGYSVLGSTAAQVSSDRLAFVLTQRGSGCQVGDAGYYEFTLSPTGRMLKLDPISDPCVARRVALTRDWIKQDCPDPNNACLGDLDPGRHVSIDFTPFVPPEDWHFDYGRFSYVVPDGWRNLEDNPDGYVLAKRTAPDGAAILLFSDVLPHSQDASCPGTVEPGVGRSASAFAGWLSKLPALTATKPAAVTVGGLSGFMLDIAVSPTWTRKCSYSDGPFVGIFTDSQLGNGLDWGIGGQERMRLWLLDLGDGRTLVIDVDALDKAAWDALLAEAMPVIQTFSFSR